MARNEFVDKVIILRQELNRLKQANSVEQQKVNGQLAHYGLLASFEGINLYADRVEGQGQIIKLTSNIEASVEASGSRFATSNGSRSTLTRTVVGYAVAGPLGAVVGAGNKKDRKDTVHDDRSLRVVIQSLDGCIDVAVNPDKAEGAHKFVTAVKNAVIHYSERMKNKSELEKKADEIVSAGSSAVEKKQKELDRLMETATTEDKMALRKYDRNRALLVFGIAILIIVGLYGFVMFIIADTR